MDVEARIADNKNGIYTLFYEMPIAGAYAVEVSWVNDCEPVLPWARV